MNNIRKITYYNNPQELLKGLVKYNLKFANTHEKDQFTKHTRKLKLLEIGLIMTPQQLELLEYQIMNREDFKEPIIVVHENKLSDKKPDIFLLTRII